MSPGTSLDASTLLATVRSTLEGAEPSRIEVRLEGAASALGPIVLVGGRGRLVAVSVDRPAGPSALAGLLLAESGTLHVGPAERPSAPPSAFPEIGASLTQASPEADRIRSLLDPHGGLDHRPRALRRPGGDLPPAVARLVEAADGQRALGELLALSELDGVKTAAAIARLGDEGWLSAPTPDAAVEDAWGAPEAWPPAPREATEADAWPPPSATPGPAWPPIGAVAAAWPPGPAPAPTAPPMIAPTAPPAVAPTAPPVLAPTAPPVQTAPPAATVAPTVAADRAPPPAPAPRRDEFADDRLFADAGVQDRRPLAVVLAVAAAVLLFVLWPRDSGEPEPAPAPVPKPTPIARVATVTPTVAVVPPPPAESPPPAEPQPKRVRRATPAAYSFANPPPVVGPGGDPEVLEAQRMLDAGDLAAASEALTGLRRKRPRDPAVWVLSGLVAEARGDLDEAYAHATRAVKVDRKAYRGWVLKGSLEQFQRKPTEAVDSYKKALTSDPDHPMSSELRGVVRRLERDEG